MNALLPVHVYVQSHALLVDIKIKLVKQYVKIVKLERTVLLVDQVVSILKQIVRLVDMQTVQHVAVLFVPKEHIQIILGLLNARNVWLGITPLQRRDKHLSMLHVQHVLLDATHRLVKLKHPLMYVYLALLDFILRLVKLKLPLLYVKSVVLGNGRTVRVLLLTMNVCPVQLGIKTNKDSNHPVYLTTIAVQADGQIKLEFLVLIVPPVLLAATPFLVNYK